MQKKKGKRHVKDETKEVQSDLTNDRVEVLEKSVEKITGTLDEILKRLDQPQKLPTVKSPDERIAAMKAARLGEEPTEKRKNISLNSPGSEQGGYKEGDVFRLSEDSPKYAAYCLDKQDEPVKQIFEYVCQACPSTEEYVRGPDKKICPSCGKTMLKVPTGRYQPGTPAYGVVLNYMYTNRKGIRKYKVHFEKFSDRLKTEGLLESEMVLCR